MEKSSPERRGFSSLLSRLILRRLMSGARTSRPEFACQENQRRSDQAGAAQQPEAIKRCKERSLLLQDPAELRVRVDRRVGGRVTMLRKIRGQVFQNRLVARVQRSGVSDQHGTMELRAARHDRSHKRDAKARSLVPEQIRQTGRFVVLLFWQE